jgi:hypothetical protein
MCKGKLPFKVEIVEDKEASVREAENTEEEVQVFADGSAMNRKVGAAAVLTRAGKPPHVLHMHLGTENEHMVHEAELVGMLLGLRGKAACPLR